MDGCQPSGIEGWLRTTAGIICCRQAARNYLSSYDDFIAATCAHTPAKMRNMDKNRGTLLGVHLKKEHRTSRSVPVYMKTMPMYGFIFLSSLFISPANV